MLRMQVPGIRREERFQILQTIYDSFMRFDPDFVRRANAYVDAGIIDLCYTIEREDNESDKVKVVYILGMVCFNNESATDQVGRHDNFYSLLVRTLDHRNSNALLRAGLYLMTNASSNSFSTHPTLVRLLPRIRQIIDRNTGYNQGTRSEGVRVCFYLASNEDTKNDMISAGVIEPLVEIMSSGVLELDCVSAAIAVANLVGDEEDSPALSAAAGAQGFYKLLVDALEASLNGTDYPVGSNLFYRNWKVVQGLANLAKADINKERLGVSGLIPQLKRCLDQDDTDGRLHEFTMSTLWQLCFHETNQARIRDNGSLRIEIERLVDHGETELIRQAAQGIMWQIARQPEKSERRKAPRFVKKSVVKPTTTPASRAGPSLNSPTDNNGNGNGSMGKRPTIMCSYCWAQQPIMIRIKERLEVGGSRVWMDLDSMSGSTLEAMASAVENADIVLVGVSKDYKNNGACRTESEFAHKLGKPFIPIILEDNYVPDGWLGKILALSDVCPRLTDWADDRMFERCIADIKRGLAEKGITQLEKQLAASPTPVKALNQSPTMSPAPNTNNNATTTFTTTNNNHNSSSSGNTSVNLSHVECMSKEEVGQWLTRIGLQRYEATFKAHNMDGESLACAYYIAQHSTNSLNCVKADFQTELNMSLGDAYKFLWNLKKLCEQ